MAMHSSILAWKSIPWTEQPGELQSTGLQRVRQHLATKEQQFFRQLHGDVIHIVYSSPI